MYDVWIETNVIEFNKITNIGSICHNSIPTLSMLNHRNISPTVLDVCTRMIGCLIVWLVFLSFFLFVPKKKKQWGVDKKRIGVVSGEANHFSTRGQIFLLTIFIVNKAFFVNSQEIWSDKFEEIHLSNKWISLTFLFLLVFDK